MRLRLQNTHTKYPGPNPHAPLSIRPPGESTAVLHTKLFCGSFDCLETLETTHGGRLVSSLTDPVACSRAQVRSHESGSLTIRSAIPHFLSHIELAPVDIVWLLSLTYAHKQVLMASTSRPARSTKLSPPRFLSEPPTI